MRGLGPSCVAQFKEVVSGMCFLKTIAPPPSLPPYTNQNGMTGSNENFSGSTRNLSCIFLGMVNVVSLLLIWMSSFAILGIAWFGNTCQVHFGSFEKGTMYYCVHYKYMSQQYLLCKKAPQQNN